MSVYVPSISATPMRNAFLSSSTRFLPRSMNSSNRTVKCAMRSRRSLKLKSMLGSVSAIEGAMVLEEYGGAAEAPAEKEEPKRLGVIIVAAIWTIWRLILVVSCVSWTCVVDTARLRCCGLEVLAQVNNAIQGPDLVASSSTSRGSCCST